MKHRFYLDADLVPGAALALSGEEAHHAHVLRVREGEDVEVFNGRGGAFIAMYAAGSVTIREPAPDREAKASVHLAMAIIQLEKFELVLQKATELGVRSIIPLVCDRTEVRAERYRGKGERWQKIVFEAVKQSGRSRIPIVETPVTFDEAMQRDGAKIVFDADAERRAGFSRPSVEEHTRPAEAGPTFLFIGPEGGFSERELALAGTDQAHFENLGPRRLRAETAAIVAAAIVAARHGDI
jgi:16S rRNA (uracil1498-N3)-methyltransferase